MNNERALTQENIRELAEELRNALWGKRYSVVINNEFYGFAPEVRLDQCLQEVRVSEHSKDVWFLTIEDTYGVAVYKAMPTEAEATTLIDFSGRTIRIKLIQPDGRKIYETIIADTRR